MFADHDFFWHLAQVGTVELIQVQKVAEEFGLKCLALQCEQLNLASMTREDNNSKMSEEDLKVEIMYQSSVFREDQATCPLNVPLNTAKLLQLFESGEFSDVEVTIADHGKVAMAHRLILSAWSEPFAKVRINFAVISCRL